MLGTTMKTLTADVVPCTTETVCGPAAAVGTVELHESEPLALVVPVQSGVDAFHSTAYDAKAANPLPEKLMTVPTPPVLVEIEKDGLMTKLVDA
jgi:hypothetical protein